MVPRVLVVDGQPDVRRLVAAKLAHAGFAVSEAIDGTEGLEKAAREHPAVVVLDPCAEPARGSDLVGEIGSQMGGRAPVVIVLCARADVAHIAAALQGGADDYLLKPFAPRELLERIVVSLVRHGRIADVPAAAHLELATRHPAPLRAPG